MASARRRRTFELVAFLTDVMKVERVPALYSGRVTYHDACAGLREMTVRMLFICLIIGPVVGWYIADTSYRTLSAMADTCFIAVAIVIPRCVTAWCMYSATCASLGRAGSTAAAGRSAVGAAHSRVR